VAGQGHGGGGLGWLPWGWAWRRQRRRRRRQWGGPSIAGLPLHPRGPISRLATHMPNARQQKGAPLAPSGSPSSFPAHYQSFQFFRHHSPSPTLPSTRPWPRHPNPPPPRTHSPSHARTPLSRCGGWGGRAAPRGMATPSSTRRKKSHAHTHPPLTHTHTHTHTHTRTHTLAQKRAAGL
jgi:hypothetical protein